MSLGRLDWARDGRDWPNRDASRFVDAGGLRWHVQRAGRGPTLVLLHGTGASTHSWRAVLPLLATDFDVIAPDLPGHAYTDPMPRTSLPGMACAMAALLRALGVQPAVIVGHSAGAAVALQMCLDGVTAPQRVVSFNGALLPFGGWAGMLFAPMARFFVHQPLVPRLFARRAQEPAALRRLLAHTGSLLDADGIEGYARLVRSPAHVAGALDMMAGWDLQPLADALPRIAQPVLLVVGERDGTVPPAQAGAVAARLPHAQLLRLPGLGHLAHEEAPARAADAIRAFADGA